MSGLSLDFLLQTYVSTIQHVVLRQGRRTDGAGNVYGEGATPIGGEYLPVTGTATVTVTDTTTAYGLANLAGEEIFVGGANASATLLYPIARLNVIQLN